jgi:hypothetical protein
VKRPGRHAGRAALAAFGVLAVAACGDGGVVCKPCAGNYVDPNGLIGPDDEVASIRVCIDSVCRTVQYPDLDRRPIQYANIYAISLRNRDRIARIEITTLDARNKVLRLASGTSIDLPNVTKARNGPCACSSVGIAYDNTGERFVVTTR